MEKKTDYIGVDLDKKDKNMLKFQINKIKKLLPKVKYEVKETKRGYHIKIFKKVTLLDDIIYRYLLFDDPARICMSMRRLILNPKGDYFDLLFDKKNGYEKK